MPDLLIELFSEEIPARMQRQAAADLRRLMTDGLVEAGLTYKGAAAFATPRRLALSVEGLTARSPTLSEERKGPRTDAPEAALEGFLRKAGLRREDLTRRETPKGEVWMARITRPGRPAAAIVAEVLEAAIRGFPWPKSMRWGDGTLRWVRPLHSILCILTDDNGAALVPFEIEGITAGNTTEGHRFHAPGRFPVTSFESYQSGLARAHVVLDGEARALRIRHDAETLAFAQGCEVVADEALLAEVAGLVEWPVALMGAIDERFLSLPAEVLQTSMRTHQKFFSVRNPRTGRIERFITVANRETPDHGAAILAGNRKVLAARLADAAFFWEADLRTARAGMGEWTEALKGVVFHGKLGSQADRVERIAALARALAPLVGADADQAETAARLAKADLRSAMVGEFPELQGVMGRYYALTAGEPEAVADAVRDHWSPRGESDTVPAAPVSVAVALADKLDTLTGFWAIDEKPTGSKDPFALRRAALGVIRLILGNGLRLSLNQILETSVRIIVEQRVKHDRPKTASETAADYSKSEEWKSEELRVEDPRQYTAVYLRDWFRSTGEERQDVIEQKVAAIRPVFEKRLDDRRKQLLSQHLAVLPDLLSFFHDRLKVHLREEGIRHDVIDAVLAQPGNDDLWLVVRRATALSVFLKSEDGENLTQGLKRAANLLAQAEEKDGVEYSFGPEPKLAETDEERALFAALDAAEPAIMAAAQAEDFPAAMAAIAALRAPIDAFFEAVQINTDNRIVRRNRLNLLHRIRAAGQGIADFARIEG